MNVQFVISNIKRFHFNTQTRIKGGHKFEAWISEVYCFLRYGCSPDDYFRYEFYKKSHYERNKFITWRRSQRLIRQYNDAAFTKWFSNKILFNEKFSNYIGREWIVIDSCSYDEIAAFVKKKGRVLLKPVNGGQGKRIYELNSNNLNGFEKNNYREFIAEEFIQQHPDMAKLNPTSVNTIRVLTFKGHVIACALRIGGTGAIVDNLHSNGVCAHLDIDTGIVDSRCIDNKLQKYLFHPGSEMLLVGFRVPNWNKVIDTAKAAAKTIPQVQYIGWDIAVTENGTALIEGNHDPGHDVVQMIAQTGLYQDISSLEKRI